MGICRNSGTDEAMSSPFVSVVIPTHNRPDMLAEALASVRAQTFTDYEIIVVSDRENDEMRRASREAAAGCVYLELDRGHVSFARNAGIERASGEWIALLDDDDLWLPNKLERQVAEAKRTGADMITCDLVEFYPDGREIIVRHRCPEGWSHVKAISHGQWFAGPSATLIRKRVIDEVGGFDPRIRLMEDNDMWYRISWRHPIHQMDDVLMRYRRFGHASMSRYLRQHRWMLLFYELPLYLKMRRDTPRDLRWALPSVATFVLHRVLVAFGPHPWLRPRTRWNKFRHWLRAKFAN
jgi:glycosyltransferase involved in cell wall biosynthesis